MKVRFVNKLIILLLITFTIFPTSCEKDEEYKAKIVVVNNSESEVTQFTLVGLSKVIDTLKVEEEYAFEYKWTGRHRQLFGSTDNSFLPLEIEYFIGSNNFGSSEGKDMHNNTIFITNNTEAKIIINKADYEIVIVK